ncbi:T6SS immunity protein Tdi1 domain-containing protein [Leifsonia sp. NPDC058230]|uniref:T6SS immunity protein Tdi1 domain-containing protein n=1 Tax=Leifsonia sp. NPDC058230 TaxID=3346391 RepID=UPI0036DF8049
MFENFVIRYGSAVTARTAGTPWIEPQLERARGYVAFARQFAGSTFARGLLRIHDAESGPVAAAFVDGAFPEYGGRLKPFAFDWLGRQFVLDEDQMRDGEPLVLLMEPGTGMGLEIPTTFAELIDDELVESSDAALLDQFFEEWSDVNPGFLPLDFDQCAGYKVPLFLGGVDGVENLEVSNMDVYWSLTGQLRVATRDLPPGVSISDIGA